MIDHAWGYEPCTIESIKNYKPQSHSIHSGQVLTCPYDYHKTKLIVREMADLLALDLVSKRQVSDHLTLTIGYDIDNITNKYIDYEEKLLRIIMVEKFLNIPMGRFVWIIKLLLLL